MIRFLLALVFVSSPLMANVTRPTALDAEACLTQVAGRLDEAAILEAHDGHARAESEAEKRLMSLADPDVGGQGLEHGQLLRQIPGVYLSPA